MFSRHAFLKQTFKPTLKYIKVDNAAHIHLCCLQNSKLSPQTRTFKHIKNCRTSTFGTVSQVRHNSSTPPLSTQLKNENSVGLDPIPEPPSPLTSDVTTVVEQGSGVLHTQLGSGSSESMSNVFPDVYRVAMEVFSSFPVEEDLAVAHAAKPSVKTSIEPSEIGPEIYKTAIEIWKDPAVSITDDENSQHVSASSVEDFTLHTSSSAQELPGNKAADLTSESGYTSIFDSLPEPPAVTPVSTTVVEGYGHETPFSELGLGGWSPVGIVQNCLEFFHVDCGLPWWGAVVCGTVIIRLLMFPLVVIAQRNLAKLNNSMPEMQHMQAKVTAARQRGDKYDAARYTQEMMVLMKEKNINPIKNMLPPLFQAPVFISVFMGLRGMTNLPVESLKTGGLWWFVDLTVQDQFYLLPIITSATLYCTIQVGADGTPAASQNMFITRYIMRALPLVVLPFTIGFPGLILVYWTASNFFSLLQVAFIRTPKVREYLQIEKLVQHQPTALAIQDKGFMGNMKDAWNNLKKTAELQERERADRMAISKAGQDPIKKTYKYYPNKVKPAIQDKKNS